ncbi:cytochrome P450 [Aspergillus avenaceus]|uniref:Cytochrome P450 n=1 Tax=Aspergillus avenaceus TaxID=36643 RepID=A0A5N6U3W4_ASPAV|nr:cytochrome P450 [Aspergillus avenaceus]
MLWSAISISLAIAFSVISALRLYKAISKIYRSRKLSKEWNCQPVKSYPSGVFGIKVLRYVIDARRKGQIGQCLHEAHSHYGNTMKFNILGHEVMSTSEPENIQAVLASQFSSFGLSRWRYPQYQPLLGKGIFTSDGMAWEHSRKWLRLQFTKTQVPSFEWFDSHFHHFMEALPPDDHSFDIQQLYIRLALDAATGYLFGESANSLVKPYSNQKGIAEASASGDLGFAEAFDYAQGILFRRSCALSYYWVINPKTFQNANHVVHKFINYYVNKAIEYRRDSNTKSGHEEMDERDYCFLRALAMETDDRDVLRDQMVNVLLASRDDVASALSSTFYLLARDSVAWQRLRDEVTYTVEKHGSKPSLKEIQSLPYLRGVLYEALRLFTPVPINARVARHDTTLPMGGGPDGRSLVFIPKGQTVLYSVWCLHRRPDIWGADSESFRPERWAERKQTAWEFLPFNGGPRACLGQQFAITLISHQVFRLVQHIETLESAYVGPNMGLHPSMRQTLTMCHENGVHVRVHRARS